jgi:hypothetical protein
MLADDFLYTSPFDDQINRQRYEVRCWPHAAEVEAYDIDSIIENGDEAFVRYRCWMKDGKTIRCTEYFKVRDGKILEIDVFWGGRKAPKAFKPCYGSEDFRRAELHS